MMREEEIKKVMGEMPCGLYIIGSTMGAEVNAMMADWVMQISFVPRLIVVSLENDAHTLQNIRASGVFTVNFLSQDRDSMDLAAKFAQPYYDAKIKGRATSVAEQVHRKLEGIAFTRSAHGCPVLAAAMAWLDCQAVEFVPAGDHTLVTAEVTDGQLLRDAEPLTNVYTGWPYSG